MANFINNQSNRNNLNRFDLNYLQWIDTRRRVVRTSRRLKSSDVCVDLEDFIDMLEILLEVHQMTYTIDRSYQWKLNFPYMFIKPSVGDKIKNVTLGEVYEILHVETLAPNIRRQSCGPIIRRPKENVFTGVIILKAGTTAPRPFDKLEFLDKEDRLIPFTEWGTRRHSKEPSSSGQGDIGQGESGRFLPTITWSLSRSEPAALGGQPFGPQKMLKYTFREKYPDPEFTYLQDSDNYIDAKKLHTLAPTGTPFITGSYSALTQAQADPRSSTHSIEVYGHLFDNLVQFDFWSTNNNEANDLTRWFEDFIELYTQTLKENGVSELLFWERLQDQTIERWRNDIDNRTIRFYLRTEKLKIKRTRNFRKFNFTVSVAQPTEEIRLHNEATGIGTYTGQYGYLPNQVQYDTFTGVAGHYTGDGSYLWGTLTLEQ